MRSAKFLTADLVYIYRPNLHVTDRRIAMIMTSWMIW